MSRFVQVCSFARSWRTAVVRSGGVFLRDAGHGLLEVGHNSLALLGLLILGLALFASSRPDVRHALEGEALNWLQARQEARTQATAVGDAEPDLGEPDAIARATASDPKDLSRAQAGVALWLARRYHVAPEPVSRLVQEAWTVGALVNLDPTLILAVMAVESSFNPFAQSPVGAQGLMQVMTKVHDDKYEAFGGSHQWHSEIDHAQWSEPRLRAVTASATTHGDNQMLFTELKAFLACRRRPNFDHPCRLNIDQGRRAATSAAVCG